VVIWLLVTWLSGESNMRMPQRIGPSPPTNVLRMALSRTHWKSIPAMPPR
jgi:hypothetical protein